MGDGISGFGTTLSGSVAGTIAEITGVSIPGFTVDDIDITTMDSPGAWREFIAGLKNAGQLDVDGFYEDEDFDSLLDNLAVKQDWTITLPNGATLVAEGYIKDLGDEVPMDAGISRTFSIKLSGEPVYTPAST